SFPLWSLQDLLTGKVPATQIKNRIILIGTTAPSLRDLFPVSQTRFLLSTSQFQVPGVEIHAHRLASLLDRTQGQESRLIRTASPWMNSGLEIVAILLGIYLGNSFLAIRKSVIYVFLGTSLFVLAGFGALYLLNYWLGITLPAISFLVMGTVAWIQRGTLSQQHRQQIERLLGQATSPEVAQKLWENRDNLLSEGRFEGRQLIVTVMFSDIADFTTVSEGMRPNDLLDWINRGMRQCISSIVHSGGIVNKFTGDGFLAAFGAPVSHGEREDACFAVKVALEIADHLEKLNSILATEGKPPMRLRIGIHTGPVVAGSMGGTERLEYCILGDAVNCASRLESIEKQRHEGVCRILVSADTRHLVESSQTHLNWKEWGCMHLKGRNQPIQIWELLSSRAQPEQNPNESTPSALTES
ncbi:adenylate/guanylate cyclase domain-containing protein, partial [Aphanothece microscopica]